MISQQASVFAHARPGTQHISYSQVGHARVSLNGRSQVYEGSMRVAEHTLLEGDQGCR